MFFLMLMVTVFFLLLLFLSYVVSLAQQACKIAGLTKIFLMLTKKQLLDVAKPKDMDAITFIAAVVTPNGPIHVAAVL